ncbi:MAG: DUF2149 domain-containing protein [Asticcacaulis sp.]
MMRFIEDDESDDPILSVVNLVDLFLVVAAVLMVMIATNPLNPFQTKNVVVVENPGQDDMRITIKDGEKLTRYESSGEIGEGQGTKAGVTYRLPSGELVYVPEGSPITDE